MEKLITMGLDSKSFQDLVMASSYMGNSLCPQTPAEALLLLRSFSQFMWPIWSHHFLICLELMPILQKSSLSIVHSAPAAHQARYVRCVVGLGQRGTFCQIQERGEHHFIPASILSLTSSLHNPLGCKINIFRLPIYLPFVKVIRAKRKTLHMVDDVYKYTHIMQRICI